MDERAEILCFQCGQRIGDPPLVHVLRDGQECPACLDRLLELLPPLIPSRSATARGAAPLTEDDPSQWT
jgi:hypothetical protein